jgi:hypothetical protein
VRVLGHYHHRYALGQANGVYSLVHGEQAAFECTNGFEEITWIQGPTNFASTRYPRIHQDS